MNYWLNKDERKKLAVIRTTVVEKEYKKEIQESIKNTVFYGIGPIATQPSFTNTSKANPNFILKQTDSVSGAFDFKDGKTAIVNFASYKNPGGMFINGSSAQEECLCHESFLYNVLRVFENTYYTWNRNHLNKALYTNRALYSPDIVFEHVLENNDILKDNFDVITCAAPNYGAAARYQNVSREENTKELTKRIVFIKNIAQTNKVNTLVFGAFGCGVFKQSADEVAQLIKEIFKETSIKNIVLPIPDDKNYKIFEKYFGELNDS